MKILKILGFVLALLFGAFMIVYGEIDDSPGGQGLGLLAVIMGVWGIVKQIRRNKS